MSNPAQYPRRTKCGIRKGPPFGLWIWCILLKCFVSLPCIFSSCSGVNISLAVYPRNPNILYGNPLELFCVAEDGTAEDLVMLLGTTVLPTERVNSTTIRLYIERPEIQQNTYYCFNNKTKKPCMSRVLVDLPPKNVTDFTCLSKNLQVLTCNWTVPEGNNSKSIKTYNCTYIIGGNEVKHVMATGSWPDKQRYCTWNLTSEPRYRQQETIYHFVLNSCNLFGCIKQDFIIDHYSIVKPDKPSDLVVLNSGPHSIELQWNVPLVIANLLYCGIDHRIEYQINKIDNKSFFHSVNATGLPLRNRTYRFLLSDLPYAHMGYEVRIFIKSTSSKDLWSDHSFIIVHTTSEKPRRPPNTIAGAFDHSTYDYNRRRIYVYWSQLEEYEEAGASFTYKVVVSQNNKYKTVFPDKNKSLSYVTLDDASLEAMDVRIWSYNEKGSSENSSHLYIPPERETHSLKLSSFTKLGFENGTYKLSWVGVEKIDNYTLFWCQHNTTKICTGRMNFTVLEPNKNSHVIDLPKDYRYQFAISANNGTGTSGMIWAKCDISNAGISMFGFPLTLEHDAPGKSYVKVRWTLECALHDGIITGYEITYCPVIRITNKCDPAVGESKIYISDPKQTEKNITGLLPYRTYQFHISLNTTSGLKSIENASTIITTTEDMPSSPRNIKILDIRNDSVLISWDPPLHRNGNIGKYVIYGNGKEVHTDVIHPISGEVYNNERRQAVVRGLNGFTNYTFTVQACNNAIGLCSKVVPNDAVVVQTKIGAPGKLRTPIVGNNPDVVKWAEPEIHGGILDMYQVRRIKDNGDEEIINSTDLFLSVTACEGMVTSEKYQVRAVNIDNISYNQTMVYPSEWSDASTVTCRSTDSRTVMFIFLAVFGLIGVVYGSIKLYKKYRKMEDIKPVLPNGLGIPEKDISKYAFGGWNPNLKDEKPSSDEMLLLPNSKNTVSSETKPNDENCGTSDRTDSTALSDTSRGPVDRQASTSDDGSDSSLHLEIEPVKTDNSNLQDEEASSNSEPENSPENSPYFSDKKFKKNPGNGYVQQIVNPATGYVQSAPAPLKNTQQPMASVVGSLNSQPTSSSYVMAGLSPPIFTTGVAPPSVLSHPPASSGYVRPEDAQAKSLLNFPKLGPSPTKVFGPESLPTMPTLPPPAKHGADSSYIQLQSLDSLPSLKPAVRNTVPSKPPASRGYVSPGDPVISKHLNNMLSAGQLAEESAILDPTMSPDAYCRFSWSTDPANDNLRSLFADSPTINTSKN